MATAVVRMTERPTKIPMVSSFFPFLHSHCRWEGGWGWFGLVWFLGCPWVSLKWWVIGSCVVQFGRLPIRMNWSHQIVCLIVWEPLQGRRQPMRSRQEIERASTWVLRFWWTLIVHDTTYSLICEMLMWDAMIVCDTTWLNQHTLLMYIMFCYGL